MDEDDDQKDQNAGDGTKKAVNSRIIADSPRLLRLVSASLLPPKRPLNSSKLAAAL
jgi:hypothetical protein